jgi:hypothetical protein
MAITNGYCTLAELKATMRITDSVDDAILEPAIEAASRSIDARTNRRFYADANASARVYIANSSYSVQIDDISSTTGLIVQTDTDDDGTFDTTLTSGADFQTAPLNALAKGWPITSLEAVDTLWPISSRYRPLVQVTARWGWPGAIPDAINQACLLLSGRLVRRYDSPLGVAGFGDLGAMMVRRVDPDIDVMLEPYRIISVA